ncbi:hypothetical protein T484DRAFT_1957164 [Baffinella frigidus]|nr:hypothetical protein T484DRAFT_1957164 [Cryptophyta sp. CCMP2293]
MDARCRPSHTSMRMLSDDNPLRRPAPLPALHAKRKSTCETFEFTTERAPPSLFPKQSAERQWITVEARTSIFALPPTVMPRSALSLHAASNRLATGRVAVPPTTVPRRRTTLWLAAVTAACPRLSTLHSPIVHLPPRILRASPCRFTIAKFLTSPPDSFLRMRPKRSSAPGSPTRFISDRTCTWTPPNLAFSFVVPLAPCNPRRMRTVCPGLTSRSAPSKVAKSSGTTTSIAWWHAMMLSNKSPTSRSGEDAPSRSCDAMQIASARARAELLAVAHCGRTGGSASPSGVVTSSAKGPQKEACASGRGIQPESDCRFMAASRVFLS